MKKEHLKPTLRLRSERIRRTVRVPRFRWEKDEILSQQVGCARRRVSDPVRQTGADKEARIRRLPGRFPGAQSYRFRDGSMLGTSEPGPNSDPGDRSQESRADEKDPLNG